MRLPEGLLRLPQEVVRLHKVFERMSTVEKWALASLWVSEVAVRLA